jgi:hypothetical protein
MDYSKSNKIFVGRFESKTSKAGKEYMQFSLSPSDIENIEKYKNDKGWFSAFVSKSEKTGLPYLSFSPRDLPATTKSVNDNDPFKS